ncbi:MAG TPA: hypothetical protein VHN77_07675 [Phycisphaerales bacterium]|nr:hypothetical protein [Phycisphaerales bacterium]
MRSSLPISAAIALCAVSAARADIIYLTQERTIEAATTANAALLTQSAPDFAPFVATLTSSTTFQTPTGPATNTGETTIDCQLDPNAIRASGSLTGAGGLNINGLLEAGEAAAFILVTFNITEATPFNLLCTPRPSSDPRDEFEIEITNLTTTTSIFRLTQDDPAQPVNINGVLQPGTYSLQFQVEMTVEALQSTQAFDFQFLVPSPASAALLAAAPLLRRRRR